MWESIIIACISGLFLLGYKWFDPNKDMERHFHASNKVKYYLLQLAVAILTLSVIFHGRHCVWWIMKSGWKIVQKNMK